VSEGASWACEGLWPEAVPRSAQWTRRGLRALPWDASWACGARTLSWDASWTGGDKTLSWEASRVVGKLPRKINPSGSDWDASWACPGLPCKGSCGRFVFAEDGRCLRFRPVAGEREAGDTPDQKVANV
jgi:hypothetical protein